MEFESRGFQNLIKVAVSWGWEGGGGIYKNPKFAKIGYNYEISYITTKFITG